MQVLVSDTSVLVDLERGSLLDASFSRYCLSLEIRSGGDRTRYRAASRYSASCYTPPILNRKPPHSRGGSPQESCP